MDTVFLRLLAETPEADVQEMALLVHEANDTIVLPDVEPVLVRHKRYPMLVAIYERRRETGKLLDLLATYVSARSPASVHSCSYPQARAEQLDKYGDARPFGPTTACP